MYYRDQLKGKLSGKQQHKQNSANQTEAFFAELCKWMWLEKFKTVAHTAQREGGGIMVANITFFL